MFCYIYFVCGLGLFSMSLVWVWWKVWSFWVSLGLNVVKIWVVNKFVLVVLVGLIVSVLIGMFFGICMIE